MLAAALSLLLASPASAIDEFKRPPDGSKLYGLEKPGGNQACMEISWHWQVNPTIMKLQASGSFICQNRCYAKKHPSHEKCDFSCDIKCMGNHRGHTDAGTSHSSDEGQAIEQAFAQFGVESQKYSIFGLTQADSGMGDIDYNPAYTYEYSSPCWTSEPCSYSAKGIELASYEVEIVIQLLRLVPNGDGTFMRANGPRVVLKRYASFPVPDSLTFRYSGSNCKCTGEATIAGVPFDQIPDYAVTCTDESGDTRVCTGQEMEAMQFEPECEDMNHATLACSMPAGMTAVQVPAGWEFDCVDGTAQDTQAVEDMKFTSEVMMASTAPTFDVAPRAKVKTLTMCLEMTKKEPNRKLKYRLAPPSNPLVQRSAMFAANSRRRGVHDQVRTWIITDHATYDEVAKLLVPVPSPAMYLRELKNAEDLGAFTPSDPKSLKMLQNDLLATPGVEAAVMDQFIRNKLRVDRPATLKWISTHGKFFAEWFADVKSSSMADAIGHLVSVLAGAGDDAATAAIDLLMSEPLTEFRSPIGESDGIGAYASLLTSPCKPALAEKAVQMLETYKHPSAQFAYLNAHSSLSASLKKRLGEIE